MLSRLNAVLFGDLLDSERGARRLKLAGLAIGANVVSKALGFIVVLYSTRVALDHLGAERFGVWTTIASVSVLLSFMDLGLPNALIARVATLSAKGEAGPARYKAAADGLAAVSLLGAIAAVLVAFAAWAAPLERVFRGLSPHVVSEARTTAYVFALLFGMSLPAQGIYKIYAGLQRAWATHSATALAWLVSLMLVSWAPVLDAPMWYYLAVTFGVQQLGALLLVSGLPHGMLRASSWTLHAIRNLRNDPLFEHGRLFLIMQIAVAVVFGSNQLILSAVNGPTEAAHFSVLQRLFMIVQISIAIMVAPLWAAFADAKAHQDIRFMRSLLARSMAITAISATTGCVILVAAGQPIVRLLAGEALTLSTGAFALMAVWTVLEACGNAFAMYQNGVGAIRPQAIAGVLYAVLSVPLKIYAAGRFGLYGLLAVMSAGYVLTAVVPYLTVFRRECFAPIALARGEAESSADRPLPQRTRGASS